MWYNVFCGHLLKVATPIYSSSFDNIATNRLYLSIIFSVKIVNFDFWPFLDNWHDNNTNSSSTRSVDIILVLKY